MPSIKTYCFFCCSLLLWLLAWMFVSWGAVQDDAFIHFRYANNLLLRSFVTYDGVHRNYGSSSLLYIGILSVLRRLTESPGLPRAVSSAVHLVLFAGLATALWRFVPQRAKTVRLAGGMLLALLVTPSAVRWLEDGMETGLVVSAVTAMALMIHRGGGSRLRAVGLGVTAFLAVMLRTELLLLCGVGVAILALEWRSSSGRRMGPDRRSFDISARDETANASTEDETSSQEGILSIWPTIALAVGAAVAVAAILSTMHALLPDTAVAKSHGIGHWLNPIHDTAVTLAGAFSFGAGMLAFWLLTLGLVAMRGGLTLRTALANCFCPVVLALSSLRGQEIQGVRYFAWTFAFSIMWNILELARAPEERFAARRGLLLLYAFGGLLLLELPIESVAMHRVLTRRSETMRVFESQHLEVLRTRRGVASDVGYIGYFTGAEICDLAGLVNGREAARLSTSQRVRVCALTQPEFMFLNSSQYGPVAAVMAMDDWKVCGQYDFTNVRTADRHYLLVRPENAEEVCKATGRQPEAVEAVFGVETGPVVQAAGE